MSSHTRFYADTTRTGTRLRSVVVVLLAALGIIIGVGSLWALDQHTQDMAYTERIRTIAYGGVEDAASDVASTTMSEGGTVAANGERAVEGGKRAVDVASVKTHYPAVIGWIEHGVSNVDHPFVQGRDNTYYLKHDVEGKWTYMGSVFLDARNDAHDKHRLIYGHHFGVRRGMFSDLYRAYEQSRFDELARDVVTITDVEGNEVRYQPIFAQQLMATDESIQTFSFESDEQLRLWLEVELSRASAQRADAQLYIDEAREVVSLVTCSSARGGAPLRSIMTCVALDEH